MQLFACRILLAVGATKRGVAGTPGRHPRPLIPSDDRRVVTSLLVGYCLHRWHLSLNQAATVACWENSLRPASSTTPENLACSAKARKPE